MSISWNSNHLIFILFICLDENRCVQKKLSDQVKWTNGLIQPSYSATANFPLLWYTHFNYLVEIFKNFFNYINNSIQKLFLPLYFMVNKASCLHTIRTVKQPDRSFNNNRYFYKNCHCFDSVHWRWHDSQWNINVVNTVMANTAQEGSAQCPNATGTHHNKLCLLIFRQFADHFSWIVAFLLVELKIQL